MVVVSVIVPVRNAQSSIGALLDCLYAQTYTDFEIIVVDNASSDRTAQLAGRHPSKPTVISEPVTGSYRARNTGVQAAAGSVLAFTDGDCLPHPEWLAAGVSALGDADLVGGAVHQLLGAEPTMWAAYDAEFYLRQDENVANGFAATANALVRRSVFDSVGGFDDSFLSGGDHDFGARACAQGWRVSYCAAAVVEHLPRTSARELWKVARRSGAGWKLLAAKGWRPPSVQDAGLRFGFGEVRQRVSHSSPLSRRSRLYPAHALVTTARLVGRITGR